MNDATETKYTFQYLPLKQFKSLEDKDSKELLLKWSMLNRIKIQAFSYDQAFPAYQKREFIHAFFQDPCVIHNLQVVSSNGKWTSFGLKVTRVDVEEVSCSQTSMTFFDRISNDQVVRSSGHIVKCLEEFCDELPDQPIDDELKKMLVTDMSDHYEMFSEEERREFLFLLFRHLCVGGSLCQSEDLVEPYFDMTRSLYKDLIAVHKDRKSGQIAVSSMVARVTARDEQGIIYPSSDDHFQNFAYLCVDPTKKHIYVLYHKFGVSLPEVE